MKIKIELDSKSLNIKGFFGDLAHTYWVAIKNAFRFIIKHWMKSLIIVLVFTSLVYFISWTAAFFFSFFLAFLLMKLDSRVPIGFALVCLIACPFILLFHYQLLADKFAIWAYYFLVIGVVLQIIEFIREPRQKEELVKKVPEPDQGKIKRVSEGVFLPESEKIKIKTSKHRHWYVALTIIWIIAFAVILFAGGIYIYNRKAEQESQKKVTEQKASETKEPELENHQADQINKEAITISILNGNGIFGSATKVKTELENQGFKVSALGDADREDYPETIIRYQPGSQKNAEAVADALKGIYTTKLEQTTVSQSTEIVIIVGLK